MTDVHILCLREALAGLLGQPVEGTLAYVLCLPPEVIANLCDSDVFQLPGWEVWAVGEEATPERRRITADRAVDLREEKQGCLLLLVDATRAGAGMDGIYSAGREIGEAELMEAAQKAARQRLESRKRKFADAALSRARKLGRAHAISPYRAFDFFACCAAEPETVGAQVARLGLWPIDTRAGLDPEDLSVSAHLVERLLLPAGAGSTAGGRVATLLLPETETTAEQARALEEVLRRAEGKRWTETVIEVQNHPNLWLNVLEPGFARQELQRLELDPWRGPGRKLLVWSGLSEDESEKRPVFVLPPESHEKGTKERKLEVRWRTTPEDLPAGQVTYEVSVVTGVGEVLASRTVTHAAKDRQRCAFSREDFSDLEEDGKWEARVRVHPIGEPEPEDPEGALRWKESEEFLFTFGEPPDQPRASVGRKTRALVEEAVRLSEEEFARASQASVEEGHGYLTCRLSGWSARVARPELIRDVEEDWRQRDFALGRWVARVRTDGSRAGAPEFVPFDAAFCEADLWRKLEEVSRQTGPKVMSRCGFLGVIHHGNDWIDRYVNAWIAALESGDPRLALAQTVEVQTLGGTTVGLIVMPGHALRVAWHQAYDELAHHVRYQENLKAAEVVKTLQALDGSNMPAFLPGLVPGSSFVFGDMLGFYAVAMLRADEPEPQAALAQLARCLACQRSDAVPSVGGMTAAAIGREVARYAELHPEYASLRVHALRPGDGLTVAQALGAAVRAEAPPEVSEEERPPRRGFALSLFPSAEGADARMLGRFLSETTERRRAGAGAVAEGDRWMLESFAPGGVTLPRLRWSKRSQPEPTEPTHLTVAFDTFAADVVALSEVENGGTSPLEAYGLVPSLRREFRFEPAPTWKVTVASQVEGDRHPGAPRFTDRLLKMHAAVLRATGTHLTGEAQRWPALVTRVSADEDDALRRLHELSDWVVTVDRNAGIEYFDAPKEAPDRYETYVIDCVPERQDLDCVQLVTSTTKVGEVLRLLDSSLAEMALSCSPRNCHYLLTHLKAVSGRLAMRLASHTQHRGELIALALFHANCDAHPDSPSWLSLRDGFLVPLDDVRELLLPDADGRKKAADGEDANGEGGERPALRADLLYVTLSRRGTLQLTFVEVKYRRLLRSARDAELLTHVREQTAATRERWLASYSLSSGLSRTQLVLRRRRMARALRFYADKARRHQLDEQSYHRLCAVIHKLFRADGEFSVDPQGDRAYIFCPEHCDQPAETGNDEQSRIWVFGPQSLPERPASPAPHSGSQARWPETGAVPQEVRVAGSGVDAVSSGGEGAGGQAPPADVPEEPDQETALSLGHGISGEASIEWRVSIRGNPHLMIVGLPGMGKTTCIVNLCAQLHERGITPLVFSYHEDLETKLAARVGPLSRADIEAGLGFNPMRVIDGGPFGWIDNVGMLRDIFASIYPDLGDLQTNEIREALKESYRQMEYGRNGEGANGLTPPEFQRFFDLLRGKQRPNTGLMARLGELDDYGFFRNTADRASLLESAVPVIVRLHTTQNEVLQNATASFVLLSLYQNMFLRGVQPNLTHAVVFDEAHRAGRLPLLPRMAKECRKFGLSMIVASQEARDFGPSLYAAIANYLVLRVTEADALALAKNVVTSTEAHRLAGRLKQLDKHTAMFATEGRRPTYLRLLE